MTSALIYVAGFLVVAAAMAVWAVSAPNTFRQRALVRALAGAALTPFVVGTLVVVLAAVLPGVPPAVLVWLPFALAVSFLFARRSVVRWSLRRGIQGARRWMSSSDAMVFVFAMAAALVLLRVAFVAASGVQKPLIAHDALIYLNEALHFATRRTLDSIPSFDGEPWDVIAGHPHGFLYQAFLAHALLMGDLHDPGFPRDLPARIAFQLVFACLLLAVAAAAALFRRRGTIAVALLLTIAVEPLQYISQSSSRDGFRVVPLIALVIVLCAPLLRRVRRGAGWAAFCGVLAAWAIGAHALNLFALPALGLVIGFAYLRTGVAARTAMHAALAIGAFGLLAGSGYVRNLLEIGHPLGYGMYYRIYEGTPLAQAFRESGSWDARGVSIVEGIRSVFSQFGYAISILAFASSLLGLRMLSGRDRRRFACFAGYFILTLMLPLSGALDSGEVNLRGAMLTNFRYPLGTYTFAGIVSAPALLAVARADSTWIRLWLRMASIALVLAMAAWSVQTWIPREVPPEYWAAMFPDLPVDVSRGERWITSDNRLAYYHPRARPIFLYTKPARVLLTAKTIEDVWRTLDAWKVRAVVLDRHLPDWWSRTTLFRALEGSPRVTSKVESLIEVYVIAPAAVSRTVDSGDR